MKRRQVKPFVAEYRPGLSWEMKLLACVPMVFLGLIIFVALYVGGYLR